MSSSLRNSTERVRKELDDLVSRLSEATTPRVNSTSSPTPTSPPTKSGHIVTGVIPSPPITTALKPATVTTSSVQPSSVTATTTAELSTASGSEDASDLSDILSGELADLISATTITNHTIHWKAQHISVKGDGEEPTVHFTVESETSLENVQGSRTHVAPSAATTLEAEQKQIAQSFMPNIDLSRAVSALNEEKPSNGQKSPRTSAFTLYKDSPRGSQSSQCTTPRTTDKERTESVQPEKEMPHIPPLATHKVFAQQQQQQQPSSVAPSEDTTLSTPSPLREIKESMVELKESIVMDSRSEGSDLMDELTPATLQNTPPVGQGTGFGLQPAGPVKTVETTIHHHHYVPPPDSMYYQGGGSKIHEEVEQLRKQMQQEVDNLQASWEIERQQREQQANQQALLERLQHLTRIVDSLQQHLRCTLPEAQLQFMPSTPPLNESQILTSVDNAIVRLQSVSTVLMNHLSPNTKPALQPLERELLILQIREQEQRLSLVQKQADTLWLRYIHEHWLALTEAQRARKFVVRRNDIMLHECSRRQHIEWEEAHWRDDILSRYISIYSTMMHYVVPLNQAQRRREMAILADLKSLQQQEEMERNHILQEQAASSETFQHAKNMCDTVQQSMSKYVLASSTVTSTPPPPETPPPPPPVASPASPPSPSLPYPHGRLFVTIHQGNNLPFSELVGKPDAFALVYIAKQVHATPVIKQNPNPVWNSLFEFFVPLHEMDTSEDSDIQTPTRICTGSLLIEVHEKDAPKRESIGKSVIPLNELIYDKPTNVTVTLRSKPPLDTDRPPTVRLVLHAIDFGLPPPPQSVNTSTTATNTTTTPRSPSPPVKVPPIGFGNKSSKAHDVPKVMIPYLGLELSEGIVLRDTGTESAEMKVAYGGVRVLAVHSPATHAGILAGDLICKVHGIDISSLRQFKEVMETVVAGQKITVIILRNGERFTKIVQAASRDPNNWQPGQRHTEKVYFSNLPIQSLQQWTSSAPNEIVFSLLDAAATNSPRTPSPNRAALRSSSSGRGDGFHSPPLSPRMITPFSPPASVAQQQAAPQPPPLPSQPQSAQPQFTTPTSSGISTPRDSPPIHHLHSHEPVTVTSATATMEPPRTASPPPTAGSPLVPRLPFTPPRTTTVSNSPRAQPRDSPRYPPPGYGGSNRFSKNSPRSTSSNRRARSVSPNPVHSTHLHYSAYGGGSQTPRGKR